MFAAVLLIASIIGLWALVHTYRCETAYERRMRHH